MPYHCITSLRASEVEFCLNPCPGFGGRFVLFLTVYLSKVADLAHYLINADFYYPFEFELFLYHFGLS